MVMVQNLKAANLTLTPQELRSLKDYLAFKTQAEIKTFLDGLSPNALASLPWLFEVWAMPHQLAPEGKWRNWLLLGGRGAGKTRAGSEWVRSLVEGPTHNAAGKYRRIALVADTIDQAREVMVMGESGIMACTPPDRRPEWIASRKMLKWANGATAQIFSGSDPESLRGPQFDAAWLDEFGKWKKAKDTWEMLQFGLRLGDDPKVLVTTTPRTVGVLKSLMENDENVITHAPTSANRANLAPGFIEAIEAQYAGTRLGRQEIDGEMVTDIDGALFTYEMIEKSRDDKPDRFDRIVVSIDPPASHNSSSDECGIVVVGATYDGKDIRNWKGYVLADVSLSRARPEEWAAKAIAAYHDFGADCVIAEVNQGGNMVESILRQVDQSVAFRAVHASKRKSIRAEPVAALYAQGRIKHCEIFEQLEEQMLLMSTHGYEGQGSPDRLDAMVWALSELLVNKNIVAFEPKIRTI